MNKETIAAIEAARRGELETFATIKDLLADLNTEIDEEIKIATNPAIKFIDEIIRETGQMEYHLSYCHTNPDVKSVEKIVWGIDLKKIRKQLVILDVHMRHIRKTKEFRLSGTLKQSPWTR